MLYDAFISYRHGELDGLVAARLHRMLETFRVPKAIAAKTGKKRIARVFIDKEELPTSSDLSSSIENALSDSEFLILICSRRTLESRWVLQEVERFIELGRRDKIITLLIDGEPEDSFPEPIRWREKNGVLVQAEPLAADIRANTQKESLKLLKGEVLRLVAPILGCAYDDLRQRHKERAMRRIFAFGALTLAVSLIFGAVTFHQLLRINEQMRMKLYNQSYVLAEYSAAALAGGDPVTAALLALEALPKDPNNPERPYVGAAEVALTKAVGAYDYRDIFVPHRKVEAAGMVSAVALSPDESYCTILSMANMLELYSTAEGTLTLSFKTIRSVGRNAVFPAPDVMVYTADDALRAVRIPSGEELWRVDLAHGVSLSGDGSTIAAACDGYALLLTLDGRIKKRIDFGGRKPFQLDAPFDREVYNCFVLNEDGSLLAVNFTDSSFSVFNTRSGEENKLLSQAGEVNCYFSDDHLVCYWVERAANVLYNTQSEGSFITVFDIPGMNRIWEKPLDIQFSLVLPFDKRIAFTEKGNIQIYDPKTGQEYTLATFPDTIIGLKQNDGHLLVGGADGNIMFHPLRKGENIRYRDDYSCNRLALGYHYAVAAGTESSSVRILKWNDRKALAEYKSDSFSIDGNNAGDRVYLHGLSDIKLFDASSGDLLFSAASAAKSDNISYFKVDAESGSIIELGRNLCRLYSGRNGSLLYDSDRNCLFNQSGVFVQDEDSFTVIDLLTGQEKEQRKRRFAKGAAWLIVDWTADWDGVEGTLVLTHSQTGEERLFEKISLMAECITKDDILLCFYKEGKVQVYSIEKNSVLFEITPEQEIVDAGFVGDGMFLFLSAYIRGADIYAIPSGKRVDNLAYKESDLWYSYTVPESNQILTSHFQIGLHVMGFLRDAETYEPTAEIFGFRYVQGDGSLLVQYPFVTKSIPLVSSEEVFTMARELVGKRELTPEQRRKYHIEE